MSQTPAAAPIPPGWYDDGTGSGTQRWWSGVEWTEHVASPYATVVPRPQLPADRPVYSVWIWLIVLLPLLVYVSFFFWRPDFSFLSNISTSDGSVPYVSPFSLLGPGYFLIIGLSWIVYALTAVFAWRDSVWLRAQGVVRPFAWPWIFLNSWVYIIGRAIIVRRVAAPRGLAPIWVTIAVFVVGMIITIVWTFSFMAGFISEMPRLPDSAYTS